MSGYGDEPMYDDRAYVAGRPPPADRGKVNAARLWAAGLATAVVCALIGLVGVLIVRAVLKVALYAPEEASAFGDIDTALLCIAAAGAALVATGLAYLLLVSTPRPLAYFGWIVGLLTVVAAVLPLLAGGPLAVLLAEAILYVVIGVVIAVLTANAAGSALRYSA